MLSILLSIIAATAQAQPVPYTMQDLKSPQDVSAINQDFKYVTDYIKQQADAIAVLQSATVSTATNFTNANLTGNTTIPSGSTFTIQGYYMQDIFIGSYTFSGVNVGTITLVSTGTYKNYHITAILTNAAGAAQNLFIKVGTDTSSAYSMTSLTAGSVGTAYDQGCSPGKRALANGGSGFNEEWYQSANGDVDIDIRQLTAYVISIKSTTGAIPYAAAPSPAADILSGSPHNLYFGGSFQAYGTIGLSFGTWSSCTAITDTGGALTGSVWVYARGAER
jgi:hypothetical protein